MSKAKSNFLDKMKYFSEALKVDRLNDIAITGSLHNNIARILRNGLAVVGFVALEDFIKNRTAEVLEDISKSSVNFNSLPESIRYAATVDVINALNRLVKLSETKSDKIDFMQQQTQKISSTLNINYEFSEYTFGYKNSNIDEDTISDICSKFNIEKCWDNMSKISSRIGLIGLPLRNSFINAKNRRHNAAHVYHSNTPINDLDQFINEATGIAIGFDCLISKANNQIKLGSMSTILGKSKITDANINLSYIKKVSETWKYKKENLTNSSKNENNESDIYLYAIPLAQKNKETIICYNEDNKVSDWYCF